MCTLCWYVVLIVDITLDYNARQLNILNLKLLKIQSCLCCWYVLFIVDPCNNTVVFVVMSYVRISYRLRLRFKIHRSSVSTALISFVAILRWSQGRLNCPGLSRRWYGLVWLILMNDYLEQVKDSLIRNRLPGGLDDA